MRRLRRRSKPTPCCSARSAVPNGTTCRSIRSRSAGLLRLRKDLELFANLRPAICFDALKDASQPEARDRFRSRYPDRARTDGRRLFRRAEGDHRHCPTARSAPSTRRSTRRARSSASRAWRSSWPGCAAKRVASAEKSNVMVTGVLWREVVTRCTRRNLPTSH